jgi:hypothetical protein
MLVFVWMMASSWNTQGLAVDEYTPRSKIPNPLGEYPSSHCKTVAIINSLMSAITHMRETRRLTGNDLACMDDKDEKRFDQVIKCFRYRRHSRVGKPTVFNLCAQREAVNSYSFSL